MIQMFGRIAYWGKWTRGLKTMDMLELAVIVLLYDRSCITRSCGLSLHQLVKSNVKTSAEVIGDANLYFSSALLGLKHKKSSIYVP